MWVEYFLASQLDPYKRLIKVATTRQRQSRLGWPRVKGSLVDGSGGPLLENLRRDEQECAPVSADVGGEDVDPDGDEGSQNRHGELVLRWRQRIGREISELGDNEVEGEGVFADEEIEDLLGGDTWQGGGGLVGQCVVDREEG